MAAAGEALQKGAEEEEEEQERNEQRFFTFTSNVDAHSLQYFKPSEVSYHRMK